MEYILTVSYFGLSKPAIVPLILGRLAVGRCQLIE